MHIITIYISEITQKFIDLIVKTGEYTSRSELIRSALRDWVKDKLKEIKFMEDYNILLERYNALTTILYDPEKDPKKPKKIVKPQTKEVVKSEEVITDKDGNEWRIKEIVDVPKLTHKKGINEA